MFPVRAAWEMASSLVLSDALVAGRLFLLLNVMKQELHEPTLSGSSGHSRQAAMFAEGEPQAPQAFHHGRCVSLHDALVHGRLGREWSRYRPR